MKILEKINFRQTKYMLPAILYLPLLGGTYFIFDLFHTETAEIPDKALQTTEFLNPELPEAQIKDDGIGSKYENMAKAWGKIQDYSAVDNIDRDDPADNKEEYESQYTQDDIALLDEQQQEKALAAQAADAKRREQEALAELEKALAEARLKGQSAATPPAEADTAAMARRQKRRSREPSTRRAVRSGPRRRQPGERGREEGKDRLGLLQHTGKGRP